MPHALYFGRTVAAALCWMIGLGLFPNAGGQAARASALVVHATRTYSHPPGVDANVVAIADLSSQYVGVLAWHGSNFTANRYDAYIYDAATGQHLWTLTEPVPTGNVNFRFHSIAIDGHRAVIGATYAHVALPDGGTAFGAGVAYVYDLNTGQLLHRLVSDAPQNDFLLGSSVDLLGDRVVVGGWGTAYVFDAVTGAQLAELIPSTDSDQFGVAVAISESAIVVGGNSDSGQGDFTGAAFVFDPQTFSQRLKFVPGDAAASDNFGIRVAVDGDHAIASGASGSYVFNVQNGVQLAKLNLPGGNVYHNAVDILGSTALLANAALNRAMTFDWTTGAPLQELAGGGATSQSSFGYAAALAGNDALVAAIGTSRQFRIVAEPATMRLAALCGAIGCAHGLRRRSC